MLHYLLKLPPFVFFTLAALIFGAGIYVQKIDDESQAERRIAVQQDAPAVVNLGDFTDTDKGIANEVHIAAQVNSDYNYRLQKDDSDKRYVLRVLFDPAATGDETLVKAAILVPAAQSDALWEWIDAHGVADGELGVISHMNGIKSRFPSHRVLAENVMKDEGLTLAPGFFYIEPFLNGRAIDLAPRNSPIKIIDIFSAFAGLIAFIGFVKMMVRRGRRRKPVVI